MSELLFDKKSVNRQTHFLSRLLHLLYYRLGVDERTFLERHFHYFLKWNPQADKYEIQGDRNNKKKLLRWDDRLTWKQLLTGSVDILQLSLKDVTLVFEDSTTGKTITISSRDFIAEDGSYVEAPSINDRPVSPIAQKP